MQPHKSPTDAYRVHTVAISRFLPDPEQPTLIQGFKKVVIQVGQLVPLCNSLQQNGVTFVYPEIQDTPGVWGKWFMIEDLDGNVLQFVDPDQRT